MLLMLPLVLFVSYFPFKSSQPLATYLFSPHHYAPYVATGLIHVLQISIFSALSTDWPFSTARRAQYAVFAFVIIFSISGHN